MEQLIKIPGDEERHVKAGDGVDRGKYSLAFDLVARRDLVHLDWSMIATLYPHTEFLKIIG